mgnify:CR=1 FL=1
MSTVAGCRRASSRCARDGELVAFETFGDATNDTRYCIFSCTKADRRAGRVVVDRRRPARPRRVADYIPEFAANGKDAVTVERVMLHASGFPNAVMSEVAGTDTERRLAALAKWELEWEPGTRFEDHGTSAHWALADSCIERLGAHGLSRLHRASAPARRSVCPGCSASPSATEANIAARQDRRRSAPMARSTTPSLRYERPEVRAAGVPGSGAIARAADLALLPGPAAQPGRTLGCGRARRRAETNVRCEFPDNLLQVPVNRRSGSCSRATTGSTSCATAASAPRTRPARSGMPGVHGQVGLG